MSLRLPLSVNACEVKLREINELKRLEDSSLAVLTPKS